MLCNKVVLKCRKGQLVKGVFKFEGMLCREHDMITDPHVQCRKQVGRIAPQLLCRRHEDLSAGLEGIGNGNIRMYRQSGKSTQQYYNSSKALIFSWFGIVDPNVVGNGRFPPAFETHESPGFEHLYLVWCQRWSDSSLCRAPSRMFAGCEGLLWSPWWLSFDWRGGVASGTVGVTSDRK
jgi:hypothetical protein